jgi:hypothetical protein
LLLYTIGKLSHTHGIVSKNKLKIAGKNKAQDERQFAGGLITGFFVE